MRFTFTLSLALSLLAVYAPDLSSGSCFKVRSEVPALKRSMPTLHIRRNLCKWMQELEGMKKSKKPYRQAEDPEADSYYKEPYGKADDPAAKSYYTEPSGTADDPAAKSYAKDPYGGDSDPVASSTAKDSYSKPAYPAANKPTAKAPLQKENDPEKSYYGSDKGDDGVNSGKGSDDDDEPWDKEGNSAGVAKKPSGTTKAPSSAPSGKDSYGGNGATSGNTSGSTAHGSHDPVGGDSYGKH